MSILGDPYFERYLEHIGNPQDPWFDLLIYLCVRHGIEIEQLIYEPGTPQDLSKVTTDPRFAVAYFVLLAAYLPDKVEPWRRRKPPKCDPLYTVYLLDDFLADKMWLQCVAQVETKYLWLLEVWHRYCYPDHDPSHLHLN